LAITYRRKCRQFEQAQDGIVMLNIGFVLYTKSDAQGTLHARWSFANARHGTGIATGGPVEGFGGHYDVRYFDEKGNFLDEWKLVIEKPGDFYDLSWSDNGETRIRGIGMEVDGRLAASWRWIVAL
jgi:hypothetical protein